MGFLNKIKTAFGNTNIEEEEIDGNYIEDIINSVENIPFAASRSNVMYAGISELAGYHYFKTVIVGTYKLKTNKGAALNILGDDFKLSLNSDMLEMESEIANVPNQYVTKIDFEIEAEDIPKIKKLKISSLELIGKKENIVFNILEIGKEIIINETRTNEEEE